jgi:hypothetical protein
MTNVGAIAANFHEGSRTEYLAQYVFASFGTAVAVPHQEDSGVDLFCTITERVGKLAWPVEHFTVQVKSNYRPLVLGSAASVRWLIKHPFPLYLCCVDKKKLCFSVYHTLPRYQLWVSAHEPSRLKLLPGRGPEGHAVLWKKGDAEVSLDAPILEFTLPELLTEARHAEFKEVLQFWVQKDAANLAQVKRGTRSYTMPTRYRTNSLDGFTGSITQSVALPHEFAPTRNVLADILPYAAQHYQAMGDLPGAARCVLLLKHLALKRGLDAWHVVMTINQAMGLSNDVLEEGVNQLSREFDALLRPRSSSASRLRNQRRQ